MVRGGKVAAMFTLDWTNKDSLRLITEYRNHPILWDKHVHGYKNKLKRIDAWTDIANKFGCSKSEVERKMNVLLTQYRREKHKVMMKYYEYSEDPYRSTWYAFQEFAFLEEYKARLQGREVGNYSLNSVPHGTNPENNDREAFNEQQDYHQNLFRFDRHLMNPGTTSPRETEPLDISNLEHSNDQSSPNMVIIHNSESQSRPKSLPTIHQNQRQSSPSMSVEIHGHPIVTHSPPTRNMRPKRRISRHEITTKILNSPESGKLKKRKLNLDSNKQLRGNLRTLATKVLIEDDSDHIGANVTLKLREMEKSQRIIAEKLISDVLFYGQINELTLTAKVLPAKERAS